MISEYFIKKSREINNFINTNNYLTVSFEKINHVKATILKLDRELNNYEADINRDILTAKNFAAAKASGEFRDCGMPLLFEINEIEERKHIARFRKILIKNLERINQWIKLKWTQGVKLPMYKKIDFYDVVSEYINTNNEVELAKYLSNNISDLNFIPIDNRIISKQIIPLPLLVLACQKGNLNIVKMLCQKGAKIDIEKCYFEVKNSANNKIIFNDYFLPPLLAAIKFKNYYIAEFLLTLGANAKVVDAQKNSALHILSKNCNNTTGDNKLAIKMAKILIEKGVKINCTNKSLKTPLYYAINNYKQEFIEFLINSGANIYQVDENNNSILNVLLLNYKNEKTLKLKDESEKIKFLIENKIDINKDNIFGEAPLHYAVKWQNNEFIKLLLENENIEISITNNRKNNALHILFKNIMFKKDINETRILQKVELLFNAGIDIDAKNYRDWTPLFYAIVGISSSYTKFLIDKGAQVLNTDNVGNSVLNVLFFSYWYANFLEDNKILNYDEDCKKINFLLERDKNLINIKNIFGQTPLFFATIPDDSRYVKLLLKNNIDPLILDNINYSAITFLIKVCLEKQREKVKLNYEQDQEKIAMLIKMHISINNFDVELTRNINDNRYYEYVKQQYQKNKK